MEWFDKSFAALTTDELFRIYQLRAQVFNGEQESSYPDPDEQDRTARHLFCCDGSRVVAYARYFRAGKQVSFGRVVIQREYRGTGLSASLMTRLLTGIHRAFPGMEIIIHAQYYIRGYYAKYGFTPTGDPFTEAGRKHITMTHPAL